MITLMIAVFVLGYLAIALEHPIHINKTASALITGVLVWSIYGLAEHHEIIQIGAELKHHLSSIAEIIFFLLGAMTIVELVDAHNGFGVITDRIKTKNPKVLLWIISILTFFLSALLDNLTTSIVMVSLLRKLVSDPEKRKFYAGMVIIAANAGGAWSPIGDVTTTMLWIGGQISAVNIMKTLFIPSIVCMIVPLVVLTFTMKSKPLEDSASNHQKKTIRGQRIMLIAGVGALIFVPIFKTVTHLPPYMGMLLGLGVLWLISELVHKNADENLRRPYTAVHALSKIDTSSILFFLGILVAIGALESTHVLSDLALAMDQSIGDLNIISISIGLLSAVVDNVPLVAASMGMYPMATELVNPEAFQYALANPDLVHQGMVEFEGVKYYMVDAKIWEFIAYTAGTGGSCLIIGSAAGVAVMGMEKIDFIWYLKRISWLALIGFFAGALCYIAVYPIFAVH